MKRIDKHGGGLWMMRRDPAEDFRNYDPQPRRILDERFTQAVADAAAQDEKEAKAAAELRRARQLYRRRPW